MKRECKDGWRESVKMDEGDSEKMDEERVKMDEGEVLMNKGEVMMDKGEVMMY